MKISELLIPEYDHEMTVTRTVLERVPDDGDKGSWKPHEKAFPLGHLAQLVARMPGWIPMITEKSEFDIAPPGGRTQGGYTIEKTSALLAEFDKNVKLGRDAIAKVTDEEFQVPWHFKAGGKITSTQTRHMALRGLALNHMVHHRAQLGLYLRLLDEKVPSMYGPTADTK